MNNNILGNRIRSLREKQQISQLSLAEKLNVSNSTLSQYEGGQRIPSDDVKIRIAQFFNVSVDYLLGNSMLREEHEKYGLNHTPRKKVIKVPVVGHIAAGIPIAAIENIEDFEDVIVPAHADVSDYFCLEVRGDSMSPRIKDKDIVVFKKTQDVDTGEIAAVLVNGEDATIKQIKKTDSGIVLMPTNPAYEPKFYTFQEISELPVTILGKAVQLLGKFE